MCGMCGIEMPDKAYGSPYQAVHEGDKQRDMWYSNPDNHDPDCVLAAFYRAYDAARAEEEKLDGQEK